MSTVKISNKPLAIKLLQGARVAIKNQRERYICLALYGDVADSETEKARQELVTWIGKLLGGRGHEESLEWWLNKEGVIATYDLFKTSYGSDVLNKKLRNTRLAWIDWMISELEALVEPEGEKHFPFSRSY